jgi:hypothetical protein
LQGIILKNESFCEASEKFSSIDFSFRYFLFCKHCHLCLVPLQEMTLIETTAEAECADIKILPYPSMDLKTVKLMDTSKTDPIIFLFIKSQ